LRETTLPYASRFSPRASTISSSAGLLRSVPPPPRPPLFPYTTLFRSIHTLLADAPLSARARADIARIEEVATDFLAGVAPQEKRSEEHTSELQSLRHLVCRLLLEKKNADERTSAFVNDQPVGVQLLRS